MLNIKVCIFRGQLSKISITLFSSDLIITYSDWLTLKQAGQILEIVLYYIFLGAVWSGRVVGYESIWFEYPLYRMIRTRVLFGHWFSLDGKFPAVLNGCILAF